MKTKRANLLERERERERERETETCRPVDLETENKERAPDLSAFVSHFG